MDTFDPPRSARIRDEKYSRFAPALRNMGLPDQGFRVIGEEDGKVIVHPGDISESAKRPFAVRGDIVEFLES
ncbi:MAG TPA: hypothetical protein VJJ48_02505 [Candidatus Paceibacterota bacterium]